MAVIIYRHDDKGYLFVVCVIVYVDMGWVVDGHVIPSSSSSHCCHPFPPSAKVDEISFSTSSLKLNPTPRISLYHNLRCFLADLNIFHGSECLINWRHQSLVKFGV